MPTWIRSILVYNSYYRKARHEMKIGILGSGAVAQTLGAAWAKKHDIFIGARNPYKPTLVDWQKTIGSNVQVGSLQEAAAFGEVILLAIRPWEEIQGVIKPLTHELNNKTIIDVNNNIEFEKLPKLAFTQKSMGESIQSWLQESHIVKTLNIVPAPMMVNPIQSGIVPAIGWVSGNSADAKQQVTGLLQDLGWESVVDLRDIHKSLLQENIGLTLSIIVSGIMAQKADALIKG